MDNFSAILGPVLTGLMVAAIISVILGFVTRTRKKLQYMEAQIRLLMQIAAANGVNQDKIAEIVAEADLPEFTSKR